MAICEFECPTRGERFEVNRPMHEHVELHLRAGRQAMAVTLEGCGGKLVCASGGYRVEWDNCSARRS